jgi:hypothetical protein
VRTVVVGHDMVLKIDIFFYQERWGQNEGKCEGHYLEFKNFLCYIS